MQARPSEKAPPASLFETVANVFGTAAAGDKSESSKPARVHPATPVGHAPVAAAAPQRAAALERAATTHRAADALATPGHDTPPGRRDSSQARDVADAVASTRAPLAERVPAPAAAHLAALSTAPAPFDALLASLPVPMPAASHALLAHAVEDPSLRATVMPEHAVLSIDTGGAGELALHLRVKDGVADVRVAGAAAHTVEMRPSELRAALASEGLTLGSFQSGQPAPEHNRGGERVDDDATPRAPSRAVAATAAAASAANDSSPTAVNGRGLHVTA